MKLLFVAAVLLLLVAWAKRARAQSMSVADARATLGLPRGADAQAVRSAHRQLIARVHPDVGGTAGLAARANLARDTLLHDLARRSDR